MSLRVRLPLDGNLENKGLDIATITNNGATVSNDGKTGLCYAFNGSTSYISISDVSKYIKGGSNPFSISFWMYHSGDARRGVLFGGFGIVSLSNVLSIEIDTSNRLRFWWNSNPDWRIDNSLITIVTLTWYHIAIVYDGGKVQIYVNGDLKATRTGVLSTFNLTTPYYLGRDSRTGATAFQGNLNDFRIYDHALSTKEIKEISRGLILHYKLSDGEFESSLNLITGISSVNARCTREGSGVRIAWDVNSGDTYFFFSTSEAMQQGTTYTFSFDVDGLNESGVSFAWANVNDARYKAQLHQGRNSITFTHNKSESRTFFDDIDRNNVSNFWMGNFLLEKKDHPTPYMGPGGIRTPHIYDCSGYERDASTIVGTLNLTGDSVRQKDSMYLNGTGGIMSKEFYTPSTCSYCLWVNMPNTNSKFFIDARKSNVGVLPAYMSGSTFLVYSSLGGSNNHSITLPVNTWFHLTITLTPTTNKVYVNGVLKASGIAAHGMNILTYITLGMRHSTATFMTGSMNDFRMYAKELTPDDILDIMTQASLDNKGNLFCYDLIENNIIKINSTGIINSESLNEETLTVKLASMCKNGTFKVNEIIEK